ncbi:MAG: ThiF family adenylyltransferase [Erysipelotrichaceae bacterium]|nr:ThiF family adenylyltransferase [Erysipelotrichaceae bacterium]
MSVAVINRNDDLLLLQNQGYELEVKEGYAIISNVPYLNHELSICYGVLVSPLHMIGDVVKYDNQHTIYFSGEEPYRKNGERLDAIIHSSVDKSMVGVHVNYMFSNKPLGGYKDYYDKFTRYIEILSSEAEAVDNSVTARTFKKVISDENETFYYTDTNSSRATITDITEKFKDYNIAIIGLGGTGSYILDQVAKTPVSTIHLYDEDVFCQHNAFRAPGAPSKDVFSNQIKKTDYFKLIYENMHKGIVSHPYYIDENNINELRGFDFIFIAIDSGPAKKIIVDYATENGIKFIDSGIDINRQNNSLIGMVRNTFFTGTNGEHIRQYISFGSNENDLYQSNIQTSDLNALCAVVAVIEWKKNSGFYLSFNEMNNYVFSTDTGDNVWS